MVRHHPTDELLLEYAAGAVPEPVALVLAAHVSLCGHCRAEVARLEAVGGVLLESLEPEPVSEACRARVLELLDRPAPASARPKAPDIRLPRPLAGYLAGPLEQQKWRRLGPVAELPLLTGHDGFNTRLMRIRPGATMPQHTHRGMEMTLVLAGGFRDETGHYRRGDLALGDAELDHQPVADDDEECLCLVVTDAPLKLTGTFGRLLNPFLRS
jgi:putative transcriptional regulator